MMSGKDDRSRRAVLKTVGASLGVAGVSMQASASDGGRIDTDFNPYEFSEVDAFVTELFDDKFSPFKQLERWNRNGAKDHVFRNLSRRQIAAAFDAIRPSKVSFISSASGPTTFSDKAAAEIRTESNTEGPAVEEKWDWDREVVNSVAESTVRGASETGPSVMTTPETTEVDIDAQSSYSEKIVAYAISLDYVAYRWRTKIYWSHDSSQNTVSNLDYTDTVLHTNYAVYHKGTEVDEVDRDNRYIVNSQATFVNDNGTICDPFGVYCLDLSAQFNPYMELEGDSNGDGRTLLEGGDSIGPDPN